MIGGPGAKRTLASVAALGLAIGVAGGLGEGLARLAERPRVIGTMTFPSSNDAYRLHRPAPAPLGYELVPGVTFGDVHINAFGVRDVERPAAKPPGTFRLLVLGDSLTLGAGLPLDATYSKVLERALRAEGRGGGASPIEVWNAGVIGYNAAQEATWFERHGAALEPDLVVIGFCLNDFGASEEQRLEGDHWRIDFVAPELVPLPFGGGPLERTLASRSALARRVLRVLPHDPEVPILDRLDRANGAAYAAIAARARAGGARLAIVILPYLDSSPPELALAGDRMVGIARDLGVPLLDLRRAFGDPPPPALRIHPEDPWHPGTEGHRLIGEAIATFLVDHHLIGPAR